MTTPRKEREQMRKRVGDVSVYPARSMTASEIVDDLLTKARPLQKGVVQSMSSHRLLNLFERLVKVAQDRKNFGTWEKGQPKWMRVTLDRIREELLLRTYPREEE